MPDARTAEACNVEAARVDAHIHADVSRIYTELGGKASVGCVYARAEVEGLLTTGYEKIVMDADRCSALARFAEGIDFSEAAQAMDAFAEIGPGGHFLGAAHTREHFESAFWLGEMSDNGTFEQWTAEGGLWQHERASQRVKQILKDHEAPPMDEAVRESLDDYLARRSREIMGDKA